MKRTDCKTEQDFKKWYITNVLQKQYEYVFCIETEETVKGFPDVMCLTKTGKAVFYEFKYTQTKKIKFQPTQPAFYKAHGKMDIWVVAYKAVTDEVVEFPVWDMSALKGERRFYLNSKNLEVVI